MTEDKPKNKLPHNETIKEIRVILRKYYVKGYDQGFKAGVKVGRKK